MVKKMGIYSTAKETIKDAVSLAQQSDNIQLYKSVLDAYNAAIELMSENADLREEIKELKGQMGIEKQLVFDRDVYYVKNDDGENEGPYCTTCWDVDRKLVRLSKGYSAAGDYVCHHCKIYIKHKMNR